MPNKDRKCFWLWNPKKDPKDCEANGVDCPYKRQIWEYCRYGKIKQDSFEQENKDKDYMAERITNKIIEKSECWLELIPINRDKLFKFLKKTILTEL